VVVVVVVVACGASVSRAQQQPPSIGYLHPCSVSPGESTELTIGGYDWTPDMELFLRGGGGKFELVAPPSAVLIPDPPYWFGKKARRTPLPLPREFRAALTLPADTPGGIVTWQAANANGATAIGKVWVDRLPKVIESAAHASPQPLASLPIAVCGQIETIEQIDRYEFEATRSGPVTCELISRKLGSTMNGVVRVTDPSGKLVAEAVDSAGLDAKFTFGVTAGIRYTVAIHDLDFGGDRSFVYRLAIVPGARVTAAIPAAGRRGEKGSVELIGYGVATGEAKLESVTKEFSFPADPGLAHFAIDFETPCGLAEPFLLPLSDATQIAAAPSIATSDPASDPAGAALPGVIELPVIPVGVTARFATPDAEHHYRLTGKKGDRLAIQVLAQRIGSPLDPAVAVLDANGQEKALADDSPGSTDPDLIFEFPEDGPYTLVVTDATTKGGQADAIYHLAIAPDQPGFALRATEQLNLPIGGKVSIDVQAERRGKFDAPIRVTVEGLPEGVSAPAEIVIPGGQSKVGVELNVAADAAADASLVSIFGESSVAQPSSSEPSVSGAIGGGPIDGGPIGGGAIGGGPIDGDKSIRQGAEPMLVALTIPSPIEIDAEGKDDVLKWPRGSTFPGPVLIARKAGFDGDVVLEMHSRQGRHVMGIAGPEVAVPPGVDRFLYPVHLPEWLETSRTSRMVVNGVVRVADPKGNVRHVLVKQKNRMGFLPIGALLKLSAVEPLISLGGTADSAGSAQTRVVSIPLKVDRAESIRELDLTIELEPHPMFTASPITIDTSAGELSVPVRCDVTAPGDYEITFRATAWQGKDFPIISRATVILGFDESNTNKAANSPSP
jgi:hypothetical protein